MDDHTSSEEDEERWVLSERTRVEAYLKQENVEHLGVGEWPAFHVCPYLALWAIQSKATPSWVGWWVISGDVPTDYISSKNAKHPREAISEIISRWTKVSHDMIEGNKSSDCVIGQPKDWPELGELLRQRVSILQSFVDDDAFWADY